MSTSSPPQADRDAKRAWYRWRAKNPQQAFEPYCAWGAGVRWGRRSMLSDSVCWVSLEPMLREILDELVLARMERDSELDEDEDLEDLPF